MGGDGAINLMKESTLQDFGSEVETVMTACHYHRQVVAHGSRRVKATPQRNVMPAHRRLWHFK